MVNHPSRKERKVLSEDIDEVGKPLTQLLESITQLRHTAVHRLRVSANRLEQFVIDAESLSRLLRDDSCAQQLSRLRRETKMTIDDEKRNKDLLESKLSSKLKKIADQRAELDHLEQMAISDMMKEDKEYQIFAGANLDQAIESPVSVLQGVAGTQRETESDGDPAGSDSNDLDASLGVEQRVDFGNAKLRLSKFEGRGGFLLKMYSCGRALSLRGRHGIM